MPLIAILVLVAVGLGLFLGLGLFTLIKLGVIAQYALKDEPGHLGDYSLDESREADQE